MIQNQKHQNQRFQITARNVRTVSRNMMVIQNMLDAETHNKITKSDLLEILRWIVEEYL